jgi:hypothetical protein
MLMKDEEVNYAYAKVIALNKTQASSVTIKSNPAVRKKNYSPPTDKQPCQNLAFGLCSYFLIGEPPISSYCAWTLGVRRVAMNDPSVFCNQPAR